MEIVWGADTDGLHNTGCTRGPSILGNNKHIFAKTNVMAQKEGILSRVELTISLMMVFSRNRS